MEKLLGEDFSWELWPQSPAGARADAPDVTVANPGASPEDTDFGEVDRPRVFAFLAAQPKGRAALVLAGGGYTKLVAGKEGGDVAHWLNSIGIHAFVLIHRFPQARWAGNGRSGSQPPLDDAMEAMRQIRARRAEWGVRADGVGVVGLSSGGHLAASLAANYPAGWKPPVSRHAAESSRPDFMIIGYAPISTNATGRTVVPDKPPLPPPEKQALYEALQPDAQLMDSPPPVFIVYSAADNVVPEVNATRLYRAWHAKGGSAALHVFAEGAHGFALREKKLPVGQWPELAAAWLASSGRAAR